MDYHIWPSQVKKKNYIWTVGGTRGTELGPAHISHLLSGKW